jgi:hypothetical protein
VTAPDVRSGPDDLVGAGRRPALDGLGLLLPSSWWSIDLRDEASRRRSVAQLVEAQLGRADAEAALRRDLRTRLGRATDDAAAAGGRIMAISLMRVEGVPVPATLTVYRVPGALDEAGLALLDDVLRDGDHDSLDVGEGPAGTVVRRVRRRRGDAELGADAIEQLLVDYWVDPRDGHGMVSLVFSSPLVQLAPALLELFDTVATSVAPSEG